MRKWETLIHLFITLLMVFLFFIDPPIINDYIEGLLTDFRFKIRNLIYHPPVPDDIVIVAIDEESLKRYGRWPWSRTLQSRLIENILRADPKVVGIDILYAEPESEVSDKSLANVLSTYRDRVVLALGFEVEEGRRYTGGIPEPLYRSTVQRIDNYSLLRAPEAYRCLLPPEKIASSALFGHVYSMPDRDGKRRWEYLYLRYDGELFPSFALQVARVAMGEPREALKVIGAMGVEIGPQFIPTDPFGRMLINYLGRERTFRYIPAYRVLEGDVSEEELKGRVVLVGVTALTVYDLVVTPFSANMPGTEKNATVVSNILSGKIIRDAPGFVNILFIVLSGILGIFVRPSRAGRTIICFCGLAAGVLTFNLIMFGGFILRFNLFYPMSAVLLEGVTVVAYRYLLEERRQRQIRRIFSRYVSPKIVKRLIESPEMVRLGGVREEVTVLFSDIKGFTSLAERMPPEEVVSILNEYFREMTDVIFAHDGTLDKFVGDEIMAFWGAPVRQPEHAETAVRCAIEMIKRLRLLQQRWKAEGKVEIDAGIGVNTGEVIVGNIGSEDKKMDYTIIGDHVNLGARLEALTRHYDTDILISEFTYKRLSKKFINEISPVVELKEVGTVKVKGRENPVRVYSLKVRYKS
jgi:adenylate cyclase